MKDNKVLNVAIIDFGLGNLYSIQQACAFVGLDAFVTSDKGEIAKADALILPGVGSFGSAMDELRRLDLIHFLQDYSTGSRPLIGICLGMQLLMTSSEEFGYHEGLGIIAGEVKKFQRHPGYNEALKIPQIGWNTIRRSSDRGEHDRWDDSPLTTLSDRAYMYFVHSYYVVPDKDVVSSITTYGGCTYCSSLRYNGIFACQFHPERSGPAGIEIYRNMARWIAEMKWQRL